MRGLATLALAAMTICPAANADEPDIRTPLARDARITVGALLPSALRTALAGPSAVQVELRGNTAGEPLMVSVTMAGEGHQNTEFELIYTEKFMLETATRLVRMVERNDPAFRFTKIDRDFPGGLRCYGVIEQSSFTCMIGEAGLSFSANRLAGGPFDYATAKAIFLTLPFETFGKLAAAR